MTLKLRSGPTLGAIFVLWYSLGQVGFIIANYLDETELCFEVKF